MAINKLELVQWLKTLHDTDLIAVDDGGLTLVALDSGGMDSGAYLEIGGMPDEQDEDENETSNPVGILGE
jgi:hypothetical protein